MRYYLTILWLFALSFSAYAVDSTQINTQHIKNGLTSVLFISDKQGIPLGYSRPENPYSFGLINKRCPSDTTPFLSYAFTSTADTSTGCLNCGINRIENNLWLTTTSSGYQVLGYAYTPMPESSSTGTTAENLMVYFHYTIYCQA